MPSYLVKPCSNGQVDTAENINILKVCFLDEGEARLLSGSNFTTIISSLFKLKKHIKICGSFQSVFYLSKLAKFHKFNIKNQGK